MVSEPKWYKQFVSLIPQPGAEWATKVDMDSWPSLLLSVLAMIPTNGCMFNRAFFYKGVLLVYIPQLCKLNPFYSLLVILSYRAKDRG